MWIKGFRCLRIKIRIEDKRYLSIPFPIPLSIFQELLDCILDLLNVVCLFVPKVPEPDSSSRITVFSVKTIIPMVIKMLDSLSGEEPFDLVDVTADNVRVFIKIR